MLRRELREAATSQVRDDVFGHCVFVAPERSAIDYLNVRWDVTDGIHAIDLDGRDSLGSGIEQTFATTPGQAYAVSFDLGQARGLQRSSIGNVGSSPS